MKIFRHFDIRLLALVLALILWLHAVTEREYTLVFNCSVEVSGVPPDFVLSQTPRPVACQITANGKDLLALKFKPPRLKVDIGSRKVRNIALSLDKGHLVFPFKIVPKDIVFLQADLVLRIDRLAEKMAAVSLDLRGQPAEGLVVSDSTRAEPCSVRLWGPERQLAHINSLFTEPIRIDEIRQSQERRAGLVLPDSQIYRTQPDSVTVRLVLERTGEKLFRNVPLMLSNRGPGYLVSYAPGTVDILAAGPRQALEAAQPSDIRAVLDLKGLAPGRYQLQAVIELPDKLELLAATPRTFEVTIR